MGFDRRARVIGTISASVYALFVVALFLFCYTHPTGLGYEWMYPAIATFPWSGFRSMFRWGMLIGVLLNALLIYFVAAGLATAMSKSR